jgi:hypothetical protein
LEAFAGVSLPGVFDCAAAILLVPKEMPTANSATTAIRGNSETLFNDDTGSSE